MGLRSASSAIMVGVNVNASNKWKSTNTREFGYESILLKEQPCTISNQISLVHSSLTDNEHSSLRFIYFDPREDVWQENIERTRGHPLIK